ncbi:MAG: TlpA family protein disulfide reductase [Gammaproteobacteria bacterium]|nr:TlpA family protein disulfide reductase [Gammaproteobacteria bacterium]
MRVTRVILAFAALSLSPAVPGAVEGDEAPAWSAVTFDGSDLTFPAAAAGQPSIILFWATWCPYCKALMPYLEDIREQYESHGVRVFAINIKEDDDPQAFAAGHDYEFVYLLNGDDIATRYSVRFTPGLMVVDRNNKIVFRRKSTELPPGRKVAEYWAEQVTAALDKLITD